MSNDFMNRMLVGNTNTGKLVKDPRVPYYFYRQTLEDPLTLDPGGRFVAM